MAFAGEEIYNSEGWVASLPFACLRFSAFPATRKFALRTKNTDELKRAKLRVFLPKGEFRVAPETGTPPSIASNRDFGLGGVSVSSVSKHKKLGPPEFQNLISRFTDSGEFGKLSVVKFRLNTSASLRRGIPVALGGASLVAVAAETPEAIVHGSNLQTLWPPLNKNTNP